MPFTITYLYLLNAKNYLLWLFSSPKILQNKPLSSENSVVFALFQKGSLRDDIRVTIELLKKKGFNIIGVNTQKINIEQNNGENQEDNRIRRRNRRRS